MALGPFVEVNHSLVMMTWIGGAGVLGDKKLQ